MTLETDAGVASSARTVRAATAVAALERVSEDAGADGGEGDGLEGLLPGQPDRDAIDRRKEARFASVPAVPDRPDGVDHESCRQPESGSDTRLPGLTRRQFPARQGQLRTRGPVNSPAHATAPAQDSYSPH